MQQSKCLAEWETFSHFELDSIQSSICDKWHKIISVVLSSLKQMKIVELWCFDFKTKVILQTRLIFHLMEALYYIYIYIYTSIYH